MLKPITWGQRETIYHLQVEQAASAAVVRWRRSQAAHYEDTAYLWYHPGHVAFHIGPTPPHMAWARASEERVGFDLTDYDLEEMITDMADTLPLVMG